LYIVCRTVPRYPVCSAPSDNTFHSLGIKLGIPENDISIIKTDFSNNIVEQAYHTLDKWRKIKSESPLTLEVLNSLMELNRQDIE
jgi:transcriptional regulator